MHPAGPPVGAGTTWHAATGGADVKPLGRTGTVRVGGLPVAGTDPASDVKSVGAFKWGLVRRLNEKGVLVYSLQEREHVRLQAELRNASKSERCVDAVVDSDDDSDDDVAWYLIDDDGTARRYWDIYVSLLIIYSVLVVPYRIGFQAEATGAWFVMVRWARDAPSACAAARL